MHTLGTGYTYRACDVNCYKHSMFVVFTSYADLLFVHVSKGWHHWPNPLIRSQNRLFTLMQIHLKSFHFRALSVHTSSFKHFQKKCIHKQAQFSLEKSHVNLYRRPKFKEKVCTWYTSGSQHFLTCGPLNQTHMFSRTTAFFLYPDARLLMVLFE